MGDQHVQGADVARVVDVEEDLEDCDRLEVDWGKIGKLKGWLGYYLDPNQECQRGWRVEKE